MRTKVTLALLFLNVALFFFIFYLKTSIAPPSDAKGAILGSEVVNLQSLEITGASRASPVRLEKRGEEWVLTQPVEWPANEHAVSAILTELQQLRSEASFAVKDLLKNGQTLADYGLDNPPLTVTLTPATTAAPGPGGSAIHASILRIGNTVKVGNRLYILSPDGERVHVVHRSLAESLSLKLEDLRSAEIFKIKVFEVRSLNLQVGPTANAKVRIARDNARWKFESPIQARANKSETDVTISRLNGLRVESFVDPRSTEPLRLNPDEMTMRITLEGNNRRETLVLGAHARPPSATPSAEETPAGSDKATTPPETEWYYAKMEEKAPTFVVSVPTVLLKSIGTAQETLRDRQILDFDPSTVAGITLSAAGQPDVSLQRLESSSSNPLTAAWQIARTSERGPQTLPADREGVERLLRRLTELSAKEFISDAPVETALENFGFNRPARKIRITLANSASSAAGTASTSGLTASPPSLVMLLGIGEDHRIYAKLELPNYVYLVSEDTLSQIPIDNLAYRERVLRDLPPGAAITAIKLTDLAEQTVLLDTALPLPSPSPAPLAPTAAPSPAAEPAASAAGAPVAPSREAIEKFATQLRTLRAKRFVRDEFTKTVTVAGEERPWRYQLICTLSLVGGNGAQTVTWRLFFSERTGGNTQLVGAPDPEFDVVFEAEQPLIDALFALTYGPHDPGPTPPKPAETAAEPPAK